MWWLWLKLDNTCRQGKIHLSFYQSATETCPSHLSNTLTLPWNKAKLPPLVLLLCYSSVIICHSLNSWKPLPGIKEQEGQKKKNPKPKTNKKPPQPKGRKILEALKINTKLHTAGEVSPVLVGLDRLRKKPQQYYCFRYHTADSPFL